MKLFRSDFNLDRGKVTFWELHETELSEDLAQVHFPNDVLLDVGWYVDHYCIMVIIKENWDEPCFQLQCKSQTLQKCIKDGLSIAWFASILGEAKTVTGDSLFNTYNAHGPNPWKTWDGKNVPKWEELNDQVRAKWQAVAESMTSLTALHAKYKDES